ncbi:hypothetical protein COH37_10305 [Neisseria meningitidis]|nr:hypothetical protein COH37_10305 [Neisseria meningitidis]
MLLSNGLDSRLRGNDGLEVARNLKKKKKPKPNKPDSRLRGNDGRAVSVFSDKCRNLKSRHSHEPTSRHSHESGNLESRTFR